MKACSPTAPTTKANLVGTNGNVPEVALDTSVAFNLGIPITPTAPLIPTSGSGRLPTACTTSRATTLSSSAWTWCTTTITNVLNNDPNGYYTYNYIGNYFADIYAHNNGLTNDSCNSPACSSARRRSRQSAPIPAIPLSAELRPPIFAISTMDYGFYRAGQLEGDSAPDLGAGPALRL
jgi:hypothetical protein